MIHETSNNTYCICKQIHLNKNVNLRTIDSAGILAPYKQLFEVDFGLMVINLAF